MCCMFTMFQHRPDSNRPEEYDRLSVFLALFYLKLVHLKRTKQGGVDCGLYTILQNTQSLGTVLKHWQHGAALHLTYQSKSNKLTFNKLRIPHVHADQLVQVFFSAKNIKKKIKSWEEKKSCQRKENQWLYQQQGGVFTFFHERGRRVAVASSWPRWLLRQPKRSPPARLSHTQSTIC